MDATSSKEAFEKAYDLLLTACLSLNPDTVHACLEILETTGITKRQIEQMKRMAAKSGIAVPDTKRKVPQITFKHDDKLETLNMNNHAKFQNVADKFLMFIYGYKFNNGVNGAFGTAHTIKTESKRHKITLVLPLEYKRGLEYKFTTWAAFRDDGYFEPSKLEENFNLLLNITGRKGMEW
jgi:hypothetical protein